MALDLSNLQVSPDAGATIYSESWITKGYSRDFSQFFVNLAIVPMNDLGGNRQVLYATPWNAEITWPTDFYPKTLIVENNMVGDVPSIVTIYVNGNSYYVKFKERLIIPITSTKFSYSIQNYFYDILEPTNGVSFSLLSTQYANKIYALPHDLNHTLAQGFFNLGKAFYNTDPIGYSFVMGSKFQMIYYLKTGTIAIVDLSSNTGPSLPANAFKTATDISYVAGGGVNSHFQYGFRNHASYIKFLVPSYSDLVYSDRTQYADLLTLFRKSAVWSFAKITSQYKGPYKVIKYRTTRGVNITLNAIPLIVRPDYYHDQFGNQRYRRMNGYLVFRARFPCGAYPLNGNAGDYTDSLLPADEYVATGLPINFDCRFAFCRN